MTTSTVTPAASPTTTVAGAAQKGATAEPTNPGAELGKNAFLQLMVAQLKAQNPLEPSNGTEYVSELAQFSQLEQTTNLAETSSHAATAQQVAQAVGLIGHTVSYIDPATGATAQGTVQSVEVSFSGATLTVAGTSGIEPASITEVS